MKLGAMLASMWLLACGAPRPRDGAAHAREQTERDAGAPVWKRSCEEYARAPVDVDYEDAADGSAVLYRTKGDVRALRERTQEIARFHNGAASKVPAIHDLFDIAHTARVELIEGGAKLLLAPKSLRMRDLYELRRNVQQDVSLIQRRGCGRGQEAL